MHCINKCDESHPISLVRVGEGSCCRKVKGGMELVTVIMNLLP